MSGLDQFTKDQRDLLIALPYRVGMFVSSSDDTGGADSEAAEKQALAMIVTGFAEDFLKSEFVQAMMEETLARESEWGGWAERIDDVPGECIRAIDLVCDRLDRKEVASFKLTMMEIATFVAMAYREFDGSADIGTRLKMYMRLLSERLRAMLSGNKTTYNADEILNVSEAERKALDTLIVALDLASVRRQARHIDVAESA